MLHLLHTFSLARRSARTLLARGAAGQLLLLGALLFAPAARAQTIYGLGTITGPNIRNSPVGSQGLILINPNNGSTTTLAPIKIENVPAGQTLVGIDYRPADNLLYALGYDATTTGNNTQLFILDPGTNTVTAVGPAIRLELGGPNDRIGFDFNPTVDRIRVVSSNRKNVRLLPTTGALAVTDGPLTYASGTPATPGVGTAAYTNPFLGSTSTTLYDLDYLNAPNNGLLSIQNPPNAGTLTSPKTVMFQGPSGNFGVGSPLYLGLDIYYNPSSGQNVGYLTEVTARDGNNQSSSNTYRLELNTGQATLLGNTVPRSFNFEIRDLAVAIAPVPTITWNGSVSTAWTDPANWTPSMVPGPANDVVIASVPRQPTVSTAQQTHALTLNPGAQITLTDGSYLVVGSNFTNNGNGFATTGVGTGTVVLDLNTPQVIGGTSATVFPNLVVGAGTASLAPAVTLAAPASVRRLLTLYGDLTVTGQSFTLLSDANNTAQVVNLTGAVVGPVTVQRYIDPSINRKEGYRHYSPPVSNSNVADFTTNGFAPEVSQGSLYNNAPDPTQLTITPFPNIFKYTETRVITNVPANGSRDFDRGFEVPNGPDERLEVTRGYTVNINAAALVDFVGPLNNGAYSATNLTRGSLPRSGYHLRGNPYPAPLDWNLMVANKRLTNVDNALYVFKSTGTYTGSYASYVNGRGINGGTNVVPSSQGFFVRTSAPNSTGQLDFTNQERLTDYNNTPFQRTTGESRTVLTLSLRNAAAATQTAVYFERGATAGFDARFDAEAMPNSLGLTLASEIGTEGAGINGLPLLSGADVLVPLRVAAPAGTYALAVDELVNLPAAYHAYLRDALAGTYTDLAATPSTNVTLAATSAAGGRYAVLFTTQSRVLAAAPAALAQLASVYPSPARGTATLLLPAALRGHQATAVTVTDNLGRVVLSRTLPAGATETLELPLAGLAPGVYAVLARTQAGLVAKRLVVE